MHSRGEVHWHRRSLRELFLRGRRWHVESHVFPPDVPPVPRDAIEVGDLLAQLRSLSNVNLVDLGLVIGGESGFFCASHVCVQLKEARTTEACMAGAVLKPAIDTAAPSAAHNLTKKTDSTNFQRTSGPAIAPRWDLFLTPTLFVTYYLSKNNAFSLNSH